ncbi:MAG: hypothetical protein RL685_3416 [Pseudomonadota bacterium]
MSSGGCRWWLLLALAGLGAAPAPAELSVRLECQRRPTAGRVLCEAELEVDRGTLRWADVLVVRAPGFARPLRARVGPSALFMKTERRQRLQLALAATELGEGQLTVRARAVVCPDESGTSCQALSREGEAHVSVGPITK